LRTIRRKLSTIKNEYEDKEYAMPYSLSPDLTGVKNGSVYTVTELVSQLNTVFN
jgi:hypothetical protein